MNQEAKRAQNQQIQVPETFDKAALEIQARNGLTNNEVNVMTKAYEVVLNANRILEKELERTKAENAALKKEIETKVVSKK